MTKKPSLAETHPELAAQANGWDPSTRTFGSDEKVLWKCHLGHVTETRIADKISKGIGCQICSGRLILKGFNDLLATHPEIGAQANGWDPSEVTFGSKMQKSWKCKFGHEWMAKVYVRSNGVGCPVCGNRQLLVGFNDLATTHPHLVLEVWGWDATSVIATSQDKANWKCSFGHIWSAEIKSRGYGAGCPVCIGQKVQVGFNDLATTHPDIAFQADGWDPKTLTKGSGAKVAWMCNSGHKWRASIGARTRGTGCPICIGRQTLSGFNDLAFLNPEVAAQADGWDPRTLTPYSNKKMQWRCPIGHKYFATVAHRSIGRGCPFCSGRQVLKGYNDLATTHPEIAAQAYEWDPTKFSLGSHKRVNWQCSLGHVWDEAVKERTLAGYGCSYCSGKRVLKGFNDLATTHSEIAAEAHGWGPTTFSKGSNKKKKWKCDRGHVYEESIGHRTSMHTGCNICSGHTVLRGFNDLATTNPTLAPEAFEWDPTTITRGSKKKVKWKCSEGHVWKIAPKSRSRGEGCPSCSKSGFDPNKEGWLYLVKNSDLELLQIGISNKPKNRLRDHRENGFDEVLDLRGPLDGVNTQEIEKACLKVLKKRGALFAHKLDFKKFDGITECWTTQSLPVTKIKQLLDWVYEDDGVSIVESKK